MHCNLIVGPLNKDQDSIYVYVKKKQDGIHCQGPTCPPRRFLYLTETKSWRCEEGGGEGEGGEGEGGEGEGGEGEKVHLKTHTPLGGRVGKNTKKYKNTK